MTGLHADVSARFTADGTDAFTVDAAFDVAPGESLVVLGPSGSGKTLLLETVAGFHEHEGVVSVGDRRVSDLPVEQRDFGFVFQDYALFPHMTVTENVEYGARYHEETREGAELLAELGVDHLADRYPPTLSGGEKQRVALARALAVRPEVMLLDEPLAALDVPTRQDLRDDLADVLADVTAVYVTHNRTTARALADRIIVMRDGQVVQIGSPEAVFERPASPMVATFTGANALDLAAVPSLRARLDADAEGCVAIRPESVRVDAAGDADGNAVDAAGENAVDGGDAVADSEGVAAASDDSVADGEATVSATVARVVREDATNRVTLAFDDATVEAFLDDPPQVGATVRVTFPREHLHPC